MKIHWFAVTVYQTYEYSLDLWDHYFSLELGQLNQSVRGGRGFQNIDVGLHEAKLYYNPVQQADSIIKDYCHFEFTGSACDCVIPTHFRDFISFLQTDGVLFKVTRLDIAWDNLGFTPQEFFQAVRSDLVVTCAKRETLSIVQSPYEIREDGQIGCDTCYLGSKSSNRFVRVYNKRGGTRLEFVCRDDRAHAVTLDIFENLYGDWDFTAREHLLDYMNFPSWSSWTDFIKYAKQADLVITPARKVALIKIEKWLERQVSVALSVFYDVHGWDTAQHILDRMLFEAINSRDRSRYAAVLGLCSPFENLKNLRVPDVHDMAEFDLDPVPGGVL